MCEGGINGRDLRALARRRRARVGPHHGVGSDPTRLAFTWAPSSSDDVDTNVEVSFEGVDGGTLVRLAHTGWEALGDSGAAKRADYDAGWPHVLTRMLDATLGPVAHRAFARSTNGETWRLLEAGDAAAAVTAAHASAWHWRAAGGAGRVGAGRLAVLARPRRRRRRRRRAASRRGVARDVRTTTPPTWPTSTTPTPPRPWRAPSPSPVAPRTRRRGARRPRTSAPPSPIPRTAPSSRATWPTP